MERGAPGDLTVLRGHTGPVWRAVFSPDGQRVVTAHDDGTVRVWRCEVCGPIKDVLNFGNQHITRQLTVEERATFLNGSGH